MKILLALLAGVSLVSCATGPVFPQGPADLSKSAMFLPENKTDGAVLRQTNFMLGEIDGMSRGKTVRFPNGERGIAVTPGDHRIGAAVFHGAPGVGLLTAEGTIPMKVQAGKIYEVTGSVVSQQRVDFWIRERSTKKQASQTISVAAQDNGLPEPMIMTDGQVFDHHHDCPGR
ncbi:MAG: hypothetical protein ABI162_06190 [Luteolibacter sp.]